MHVGFSLGASSFISAPTIFEFSEVIFNILIASFQNNLLVQEYQLLTLNLSQIHLGQK